MSDQESPYLVAIITAAGAIVLAVWKTTTHFIATRTAQRIESEQDRLADLRAHAMSDLEFATGLRNELREDILRLKGQMSELIQENISLRKEIRTITLEKHTLRNELALVTYRVEQLEGSLAAAGIDIPKNPFLPIRENQ